MALSDVIRMLAVEGLQATPRQIVHAIQTGRVDEPPLNGAKRYVYGPEHVDQVRQYLLTVRRGRPLGWRPQESTGAASAA